MTQKMIVHKWYVKRLVDCEDYYTGMTVSFCFVAFVITALESAVFYESHFQKLDLFSALGIVMFSIILTIFTFFFTMLFRIRICHVMRK
jgi:hypothetical protein